MAADTFDSSFQKQLSSQSWTLYGIGMFMIILRTVARWRRVRSPANFAVDDWLMLTAVPLFYTGLVACLNIIASGGGSNLYPPELYPTFTEKQIKERIKGSKIVVISEQCMLNVIWTLKACMLFMFARMTNGTTHMKRLKIVATWVFLGWISVQIAFFTACRPFPGYWAMPPPNPQCTTLEHFAIVQAVFNISSDLLIIAVPIPMIVSLKLPLKQKIGLGLLFSMGTFVIIAAILTKVYNLSSVYSTVYMLWYTREASVAVYVANLPGIWPLLREHLRFLRDHTNSYLGGVSKTPKYGYGSHYGPMSSKGGTRSRGQNASGDVDEIELGLGHSYPKFGAQPLHGAEKLKDGENPFVMTTIKSGRTSLGSDEQALNDATDSWRQMGIVQVDTKVEIERNSWDVRDKNGPQSHVTIQGPNKEHERKGKMSTSPP